MTTLFPRRTSGAIRLKLLMSVGSLSALAIDIHPVGEYDAPPLGADAACRGFEEADDAEPEPPVADRRLPLPDALGEVGDHPAERLARLDVGAPDVAGPVINQQLPATLGALVQVDPAVVHLDRLGRVELVEDQALAGAGEDHLPN